MRDGWTQFTSGQRRDKFVLLLLVYWTLQNGCTAFPCGVPGKPVKGDFSPRAHRYDVNQKVDYSCAAGHSLVGERSSACRSNGAWSSQPPLCIANLAYQRRTEQSDGVSISDRMVDGYDDTCVPIGPAPFNHNQPPQRWWVVHFDKPTTFTNVNILLYKGSGYNLSVSVGKAAPSGGQSWSQIPKEAICHVQGKTATDALRCAPPHSIHGARFMVVEMSHHYYGSQIAFNLCEVQVYNQFDVHSTQSGQTTASDGGAETDPYYTTIIGIAVGATVASVSIVTAIVVIVCLLKRHLFKAVPTSDPDHRGSSDLSSASEQQRQRHFSTATTPTTTYRSSDSRYSLPETEYTTANSIATDHIYDYIKHQQVAVPSPPSVHAPPVPMAAPPAADGDNNGGEISVDNELYRSSSSSSESVCSETRKKRNVGVANASAQRRRVALDDIHASAEQLRPLVVRGGDYDEVSEIPPPVGPRDYPIQDGHEMRIFPAETRRGNSPRLPETSL